MLSPRALSALSLVVAGAAICLCAPTAHAGERAGEDCFHAAVAKRKTSLGVHQWTIRLVTSWCTEPGAAGRREITSVSRRVSVRTGTSWRLVSRNLASERDPRTATTYADFHLRLRYPYFEQNCYPRLEIHMTARGASSTHRATGC